MKIFYKTAFFLIILFYLPDDAFSQKNPKKKTSTLDIRAIRKWEKNYKKEFDDCIFTNKYNLQQRLTRYPYSKAAKILAVSYEAIEPKPNRIVLIDADNETMQAARIADSIDLAAWTKTGLHIKNRILDRSNLINVKELNKNQINSLTNLIYNTDYKKNGFNYTLGYNCFEPRNAFIFLDSSGKVIDYIEICIHCRNYNSPKEKISLGKLCSQKYEMLSDFFINIGITYGTNVWKNPAHQDHSSEDINDQETEETDE